MRSLRLAALMTCGPLVAALAQAHQQSTVFRPVSLPNTRAHDITSRHVGDKYQVQVALPGAYATDTTRRYPVLYVLDADKSFGLARDATDWLSWAQEMEPLIVVGIGYGQGWWEKRARDMTPSKDRARVWGDFPTAGGAAAFTLFLREELIPLIERDYRANPSKRAIAGLSFGGLYAAHVLFTVPETFTHYIMVAPAFAWDSLRIAREEAAYASSARRLPAVVYTAIGEYDDEQVPGPWRQMLTVLRRRAYGGLVLHDEVLPGESHISAWPVGLTRGLKRIFPAQRR